MQRLIPFVLPAIVYYVLIGLLAICLTRHDKQCARKGKWRIRESTLLLCGFLGGALPMYVTMKKIRHKTKHNQFMIGLPLAILLHSAVWIGLCWIFSIR